MNLYKKCQIWLKVQHFWTSTSRTIATGEISPNHKFPKVAYKPLTLKADPALIATFLLSLDGYLLLKVIQKVLQKGHFFLNYLREMVK